MDRIERIRAALEAALAPASLDIVDESHLHAGHAGARTGLGHFRVHIRARAFAGEPKVVVADEPWLCGYRLWLRSIRQWLLGCRTDLAISLLVPTARRRWTS